MSIAEKITDIIEDLYYLILDSIDFIKHNIFIFLISFILLSGSFIAIREFFYFGTITIHVNIENSKIIIDGDSQNLSKENFTICKTNKCTIELFPTTHTLFIQKEGFTTEMKNVDISLRKNSEIFIQLKPNTTQIHNIDFKESEGIIFPISKSKISKKVSNFSIHSTQNSANKKYVFFKNTPLFPVNTNNHVFISTDEIGRNTFLVSPQKIVQFNNENKITSPSFIPENNTKITSFFPQNNGDYLFQNNSNSIYLKKLSQKQISAIQLEQNPNLKTKIQHTCITPNRTLVFLAHNTLSKRISETSVFTSPTLSFLHNTEKTALSEISPFNISYIECITNNKINVFLKDKTAYSVEF